MSLQGDRERHPDDRDDVAAAAADDAAPERAGTDPAGQPESPLAPEEFAGGSGLATIRGALRLVAIREHSLLSLSELTQSLSGSPDLFHLADLVLFNLMGQFGTSKSALWLASESPGAAPVLIRAHGVNRQIVRAVGMACGAKLITLPEDEPGPFGPADISEVCGEAGRKLAEQSGLALFARVPGRSDAPGLVALGPRIGGQDYGVVERQSLGAALSVLGVSIQNLTLYARLTENNRQLRQAYEELRDLDRLKSEFLSNVNHELRTPLSTIIGYVDCLLAPTMSREHGRDMMKTVMEEALKLRGLLENLLSFSAAMHERLAIELEQGDVTACLERWCEERRPGVSEKLREFTWTLEPGLPAIHFDEKRLLQVLDALVDNAVKFTPEGSRVQLHAFRGEENGEAFLAIDVTDDGPGLSPERIPRLFEAFRQADGSSTRSVGGMGIGLAFSRQLVLAMGGSISVASDLGKGSTFTIRLPVA